MCPIPRGVSGGGSTKTPNSYEILKSSDGARLFFGALMCAGDLPSAASNEPPFYFNRFSDVALGLGLRAASMAASAAPRSVVPNTRGAVFTANESPPSASIPFHHEMAQTASPPATVLFYCERPAAKGGATPILLSAEVGALLGRDYLFILLHFVDGANNTSSVKGICSALLSCVAPRLRCTKSTDTFFCVIVVRVLSSRLRCGLLRLPRSCRPSFRHWRRACGTKACSTTAPCPPRQTPHRRLGSLGRKRSTYPRLQPPTRRRRRRTCNRQA